MKVLMLATDENIFDPKSRTCRRMQDIATELTELHIIVLSTTKRAPIQRGKNMWLYSTSSWSKLTRPIDAIRVARIIPMCDIVTVQDPFEVGWAGNRIATDRSIPLQVQVHTDFLSRHFKRSFLGRVRVAIAGWVLMRAAGIRVVSESLQEDIAKKYQIPKTMITVLPIAIDVDQAAHNTDADLLKRKYPEFSHRALILSRLTKEKNIPLAINAFRRVLVEYPKAGLIIAGEGPERSRLEHLTRDIRDHVVFEGWVTDPFPYYGSVDVFLVTSDYEGYGMTIIEALATETAVVATDVGIARSAGAMITKRSPEDIAAKIQACFEGEGSRGLPPKMQMICIYPKAYRDTLARCL